MDNRQDPKKINEEDKKTENTQSEVNQSTEKPTAARKPFFKKLDLGKVTPEEGMPTPRGEKKGPFGK